MWRCTWELYFVCKRVKGHKVLVIESLCQTEMSMETNSLAWKRLRSRRSLGVKWCREWMLTGIRRGGLSTVLASVYVVCCSFVCGQHWSVSPNKMCKEADLLTDELLVNTATINLPRPLNDAFPFCVPCLVTTVTVYTRSFSLWSIVCIEPTLTTTTPLPFLKWPLNRWEQMKLSSWAARRSKWSSCD